MFILTFMALGISLLTQIKGTTKTNRKRHLARASTLAMSFAGRSFRGRSLTDRQRD